MFTISQRSLTIYRKKRAEFLFHYDIVWQNLMSKSDFRALVSLVDWITSSKLQRILSELDVMCSEGKVLRFIRASKRRSCLAKIKEDLNDTASVFLVSSVSAIQVQVEKVVCRILYFYPWDFHILRYLAGCESGEADGYDR